MRSGIRKKQKKSKIITKGKLGFGLTVAVMVLAYLLIEYVTASAQAGKGLNVAQYSGSMSGMMIGASAGQDLIAECNQMMASYGMNQTVINSMQGMMQGMMSGTSATHNMTH